MSINHSKYFEHLFTKMIIKNTLWALLNINILHIYNSLKNLNTLKTDESTRVMFISLSLIIGHFVLIFKINTQNCWTYNLLWYALVRQKKHSEYKVLLINWLNAYIWIYLYWNTYLKILKYLLIQITWILFFNYFTQKKL